MFRLLGSMGIPDPNESTDSVHIDWTGTIRIVMWRRREYFRNAHRSACVHNCQHNRSTGTQIGNSPTRESPLERVRQGQHHPLVVEGVGLVAKVLTW